MADRGSLSRRILLSFVIVLLSCEFIVANKGADPGKTSFSREPNGLKKWTDIRNHHKDASRPEKLLQKVGGAKQNRWQALFESQEHQAKMRDPKRRREFFEKGSGQRLWRQLVGNRLLAPHVHYASAVYKKALPKDEVEVDDQPLIILPPDDSPKTPAVKHKPGGARSLANAALPPMPNLPPAPSLPQKPPSPTMVPTPPEMPVTEEVTIRPATKAPPTAMPPVKPTHTPSKPVVVNIVQSPNPIPNPPGNENNATNIQLNLEIGAASEPYEGTVAMPSPPQILTITQAPTAPPPQFIIAQPHPTSPPPQPVIILAEPTAPPAPQPIIIHDVHDPPSAEPLVIHAAPNPLVIAPPSPPSPPSVLLTSDVAPSQHSIVVAAPPPSVVVASQPASPQGAITIMGLPSMQGPTSTLLMGQAPLQTQMSPMGYPLGMQLPPQSPFIVLPSPLMQPPLSPLAPSALPSVLGMGSPMYDPQLLVSLTNLFSSALQTTLTQSQPSVLTSALIQAAIQAQTRNQPPDVLTKALTEALAQRMSPNGGQSDTNRLIQALTTALTQVQSQNTLPQAQVPVPAPLPAVAPLPPATSAPVPSPYQVFPVQPVATQRIRDSASVDGQSFSSMGKALASALVRAARNLARQKKTYNSDGGRDKDFHRPRPFYSRSYAPMMRPPFYPRSFDRRFEARDRSPVSRRNKIARWHSPTKNLAFQWTSFQPSCTCCG